MEWMPSSGSSSFSSRSRFSDNREEISDPNNRRRTEGELERFLDQRITSYGGTADTAAVSDTDIEVMLDEGGQIRFPLVNSSSPQNSNAPFTDDDEEQQMRRALRLFDEAVEATVREETGFTVDDEVEYEEDVDVDDGDSSEDVATQGAEAITQLTRRLRCLFACLTWPIVPLGGIVLLAFIWVAMAYVREFRTPCSSPLKAYAVMSTCLFLYTPNHTAVKLRLFSYSRQRDGPIRPRSVRMYDQLYHTVCIFYVCYGRSLMQACRDSLVPIPNDIIQTNSYEGQTLTILTNMFVEAQAASGGMMSSCEVTCPQLYQATSVFVSVLQLLFVTLVLPLVCLPCIYVYIIRRATVAATLANLHGGSNNSDDEGELEDLLREGTIPRRSRRQRQRYTAKDIMDGLDTIRLIRHNKKGIEAAAGGGDDCDEEVEVRIVTISRGKHISDNDQETIDPPRHLHVKECCICMGDFEIYDDDDDGNSDNNGTDDDGVTGSSYQRDVERGQAIDGAENSSEPPSLFRQNSDDQGISPGEEMDQIVLTKCGHVFHKSCMGGWIGGQWQSDQQESTTDRRRHRARRKCCPLCRQNLTPPRSARVDATSASPSPAAVDNFDETSSPAVSGNLTDVV